MKFFAAVLLLISTLAAYAEYDGSPTEKAKWVAFCINNLQDTKEKESARRVYCRCMSEVVDTADFRRLYDWERMFPPVHLQCYKKAGFKQPR